MAKRRILLVDDNDAVRVTLKQVLELEHFEVVTATGVNEALALIGGPEKFDILLSDLHMPGKGDGLTVVGAMRHANPQAVTLVFSGFPEMEAATEAILLQADQILSKPLNIADLVETIREKLSDPGRSAARISASVAAILHNEAENIRQAWLERVNDHSELRQIALSSQARTAHLPQLLRDLVTRLRQPSLGHAEPPDTEPAFEHGRLRYLEGYSAPLMVEESRLLQITIFEVLQKNLFQVDFSSVLMDVMTIADEVDRQLCHAMGAFGEKGASPALAGRKKPQARFQAQRELRRSVKE